MGYGLERWGSILANVRIFASSEVQTSSGESSTSYPVGVRYDLLSDKATRESDHSPPRIVDVNYGGVIQGPAGKHGIFNLALIRAMVKFPCWTHTTRPKSFMVCCSINETRGKCEDMNSVHTYTHVRGHVPT
jgi:hypothetical protein